MAQLRNCVEEYKMSIDLRCQPVTDLCKAVFEWEFKALFFLFLDFFSSEI